MLRVLLFLTVLVATAGMRAASAMGRAQPGGEEGGQGRHEEEGQTWEV